MASPPIAILPETSRSFLRSTTILTSLPQIIFELVQNSLDSGALQIDVGVDFEEWGCWVRDNGKGIDNAGMSILAKGGEEGRYGTSKAYNSASLGNVSTFGFRGEALASAAELSCLEISSRVSASRETWSIILKGGKKLFQGPAIRWRREQPGTTVCVRDAFYNLPIRRRSHPNSTRTLELIRKNIECVSLVFPKVAFSLENSAREKTEGSGKGRILTIPKAPSSLSAFRHLFGRALCEHVEEIDVCIGDLRIEGFLSLDGAQSKAHQYIYVNRYPLSLCELHRTIDTKFATSSFGKHAFDETGESRSPRPTTRRSPRKNERRPVYVLNITAPPRSIDNCLEPAKSMMYFKDPDAITNFLSTMVRDFLVRHGFSPGKRKTDTRTSSGSPSPRKKRKVIRAEPELDKQATETTMIANDTADFQHPGPSPPNFRQHLTTDSSKDGGQELRWIDPRTGQVFLVNPKTGNSYLANEGREESRDTNACTGYRGRWRSIVDTSRLRKRGDFCVGEVSVPDWICEALEVRHYQLSPAPGRSVDLSGNQGWQNPTFGLQDPGVPSMVSVSSSSRRPWPQSNSESEHQPDRHIHFFDAKLTAGRKHNADDASTSFDREQLRRAEIVGQVDEKFVACLIDDVTDGGTVSKILVLIDQHAADERVRVERFLSELCRGFLDIGTSGGVEIRELKPAVPVLLTQFEARALAGSKAHQQAFKRWGFRFAPMSETRSADEAGNDYWQIFVEAIPDVVGDKLLVANELREFIKGFLARLETEGASYNVSTSTATHWSSALRWCPRELLDIVNSKACRGAIMFNDPLNVEQCGRLISQLSDTVWPFMCAHGRPSLVPLTNIEEVAKTRRSIAWHRFV